MGVADAWASEGVTYTFPRELTGIANTLIREEITFLDGNDDKYQRKRVTEYLAWDGAKLIPLPNIETKSVTYWTEL
ncbi:hypothetical protein AV926_06775 [Myroides marinus]|uniref:Uncharacterized protein n=1 Tax=Myroides marinus TaxID=703342 RepID=A0A161SAT3_9FLAO|nr:hypothetical protein [Myroides marinus]KUF44405.1 hypothetical protein AS361_03200 [Myroides marinus]KZE82804.1 hypothetical protein AV926_06775 [Myroides marinus]